MTPKNPKMINPFRERLKHIDYERLVRRINARNLATPAHPEDAACHFPLNEHEFDDKDFENPVVEPETPKYTDSQIEILLSIQEIISNDNL